MRNTLLPVIYFILFLSLYGCDDYPCEKGALYFNLIGYSDAESDTIILRRFIKNSTGSTSYKDSLFLDKNSVGFNRRNDTLRIAYWIGESAQLTTEYDYQFYFPASSAVTNVTDITENKREKKPMLFTCKKNGCYNDITSYKINGQEVSGKGLEMIFLRK